MERYELHKVYSTCCRYGQARGASALHARTIPLGQRLGAARVERWLQASISYLLQGYPC